MVKKNDFDTDQEKFWHGEFGDSYIIRNQGENLLSSNINFFTKALACAEDINSCIEFGSNIGMNIKALKILFSKLKCNAIEINKGAARELRKVLPDDKIFNGSIFDWDSADKFELVLIKGVLIHINPNKLNNVYDKLYKASSKYILIGEYYNPSPVTVEYRGNKDKLFKRDFCGEMLDRFQDLKLIDYGFSYHRDVKFPQDDISWFLLKKS